MGRFDALTRLEEDTQNKGPAPVSSPAETSEGSLPTHDTSLLANQQTSKLINKFTSKLANQQTSKEVNQQISKLANQQTSKLPLSTKEKKKYGTYLREESILNINVRAAQEQKKDHELVQEIVDYYFENNK